jgi:hypothetical protein
MDMKALLDKIGAIANSSILKESEIVAEKQDEPETIGKAEEDEDFKIKLAVPFERLVAVIFTEEDSKIGRIALRKVLAGKKEKLTLRERNTIAYALINILPAIAGDRTVFNRMERKLAETL